MISLNDILQFDNLENVKIRFNLQVEGNWNPIEMFKNNEIKKLLDGHYWNYSRQKSYKEDQITVGFVLLDKKINTWLLFHIGKVTKDLNKFDDVGYEFKELKEYSKYCGRLIVKFKNEGQNMVRKAASVIEQCEVYQILPEIFDDDIFPGYDKVNISWNELTRVIEKQTWKTALENQKGVYLITDVKSGKRYVGSAYGQDMILGRWRNYATNGHGGNKELKKLDFEYIKKNFRYSILDIYKSTVEDSIIINRESWWKETLLTRNEKFGYNDN